LAKVWWLPFLGHGVVANPGYQTRKVAN